jgi:hypothetical protein
VLPFPDTFQATDFSCGASSVRSVLLYYGMEESEADLARAFGVVENFGIAVFGRTPVFDPCTVRHIEARKRIARCWLKENHIA